MRIEVKGRNYPVTEEMRDCVARRFRKVDAQVSEFAELEIELSALEFTELRTLAGEASGKGPGPESSILKIKGTEIQQRITELTLEAVGVYGAPYFRGFPQEGALALV